MKQKTAIVIGATGFTGGILLAMLLHDDTFATIKTFGRRTTGIKHPKLEEYLGDMFEMEHFSKAFTATIVFCCIGTTKAKTPDTEHYKKIDYGIPVATAKLAKANGIEHILVISAMGANPKSAAFYTKGKGEMERDVLAHRINNTHFFQPSLIGGAREEQRWGECMAQIAFKTFDFIIPKKYKIIAPEVIATAMLKVAKEGFDQVKITSDQISVLGN